MKLFNLLPAEFAIQNLAHSRLKISTFEELNDPFELVVADYTDAFQEGIWDGWRNEQTKKRGILCFSKSWSNPLLWSHYGDKHRGICLGFEVADQNLMPVRYVKERLKIDIIRLARTGRLDDSLMKKILRTKFSDWRYEKEVRVYSSLNKIDPITGLYFYELDDKIRLTDVVVGPLCDVSKSEIDSALERYESKVTVIKSKLSRNSFKVVKDSNGLFTAHA